MKLGSVVVLTVEVQLGRRDDNKVRAEVCLLPRSIPRLGNKQTMGSSAKMNHDLKVLKDSRCRVQTCSGFLVEQKGKSSGGPVGPSGIIPSLCRVQACSF